MTHTWMETNHLSRDIKHLHVEMNASHREIDNSLEPIAWKHRVQEVQ